MSLRLFVGITARVNRISFIGLIPQEFYEGIREAPGVEYVHACEVDELVKLRGEVGDGLLALWAEYRLLYLVSCIIPFLVKVLNRIVGSPDLVEDQVFTFTWPDDSISIWECGFLNENCGVDALYSILNN